MPNATLRRFSDDDLEPVRLWRNSPDISGSMYGEHTITEAEHRSWFENLRVDDTKSYWIVESDRKAVGVAYIYDIDAKNHNASWGFYLGEKKARRSGVGYYAEIFMLYFAFEHLKLNKLICEVLAGNDVVWKMHEKIGFKREGLFRSHVKKKNLYHDVVRLALLQSDWLLIKDAHMKRLISRGQTIPDFEQMAR